MLVQDEPTREIQRILTPELAQRALDKVTARVARVTDARIKAHLGGRRRHAQGEVACEVLAACIADVTDKTTDLSQSISPLHWLWTLRRLPRWVLDDELATTFGYDSTLTEILSARSLRRGTGALSERNGGYQLHYEVNVQVVWHTMKLCALARCLSSLHSEYRWAGKGAAIAFHTGQLPRRAPNAPIKTAVELYDQRVADAGFALPRMGTLITSDIMREAEDAILLVFRSRPFAFEAGPLLGTETSAEMEASFRPHIFDLSGLRVLLQHADASALVSKRREVFALLALLWSAFYFVGRSPKDLATIFSRGYIVISKERFKATLARALLMLPKGHVAELIADNGDTPTPLATLLSLHGVTWPLTAGPVIREDLNVVCLDLASATLRLDATLQHPISSGLQGQARAAHFEDQTQACIDTTPWRPTDRLRALRRRALRLNDKLITDVDAIAARGDTLLLVSCKSRVYSDDYDRGDYRTIRNAASMVEDAVAQWLSHLALIQQYPCGDNYDLRDYRTVAGVVCTPNVLYVAIGPSTNESLGGLRHCVSLVELTDWLNSSGPDVKT
jgi:hypothetical protein